MKLAFFVNQMKTEYSEYGTTRLAMAACKLDHEVWYVDLGNLDFHTDDKIGAVAHRAHLHGGDDLETFLDRAKRDENAHDVILDDFDAVWLRNDAVEDLHERPWASNVGVVFGQMLAQRGVTVVNDPVALSRAGGKLYLHEFPESIRPKGIVSRHPERIKEFVAEVGRSVVKPLYGAKGRNVFMIEGPDDPNLNQMIEAVCEDGYVTAQEFVAGGDDGDLRLFLMDGEPLQHNGMQAAFRRVPGGDDPRANISAGGKPVDVSLSETEFAIARAMKDKLVADGMFFVGVDIVGDKVVEINAESPGGLQSVEHFTKWDFGVTLCRALERRVRSARRARSAA